MTSGHRNFNKAKSSPKLFCAVSVVCGVMVVGDGVVVVGGGWWWGGGVVVRVTLVGKCMENCMEKCSS